MASINKACLDAVSADMPQFSDAELKQYAVDVFNRAKTYKDLTGTAAIKRAQEEVHNEKLASYYNDAQITLNNISKFNALKTKVDAGKTVRELLVRRYSNMSSNVESSQRAAIDNLSRQFFDELDKEDIAFLQHSDNQTDIANAIDGRRATPQAEKIATQYHKYVEARNAEMVNSNALPLDAIQKDRYLRAAHDPGKLISGGQSLAKGAKSLFKYDISASKNKWINTIKQHLDLDKTFANTDALDLLGKVDDAKANQILSNIFDNITTGKSDIYTKSAVINDREAQARRSQMFFVWKDMKSFTDYNKQYGHGDLNGALMADLHASGNKIGMAQLMGDSPSKAYLDLRAAQQEVTRKGGFWWRNTDNMFKEVTGESKAAVSPGLANFMGNIRSYTAMARLGSLLPQSLSDANMAASYASRWGINYGRAMVSQFDSVLRQATDEEKKYIGKLLHTSLQSHMGYMGKFADAQNMSALTGKLSTKYYRITGMHAWDQGNRIGIMHLIAKHLFNQSGKGFADLSPDLQKQLTKFEITPKEWDVLRSKNSNNLFTTDNVNAVTNDELKQLYSDSDKSIPLHEMRNNLYRKVYSVFDVASENAILTPGAFQRAFMFMGTQSGTIPGELMRTFMQFKGFPLSYIDRMLIGGFRDADGVTAKLGWALQQFGFMLPLAYLSTYTFYLSQGLSMPDPSRMSWPEKVSFYSGISMAGLGSLSSIMDPTNQNSNLVTNLLMSPSMRFISNAIAMPLSMASGNPSASLKAAKKSIQYILPGATFPGVSPYLKAALGEKQFLQPGQTQLYGQ